MDNMMNYLNNRKSIRDFKMDPLSNDLESNVLNAIREIEKKEEYTSARFDYFRDGEKIYRALEGLAGYAGVMIKAPSYIALEYLNKSVEDRISAAFMMEELITELRNLGLFTCWVTLGEETKLAKKELFGEAAENIDYILAIGHAESSKPFEKEVTSSRKSVDEFVFLDDTWEESADEKLKNINMLDLFSVLRYAPSYANLQPWRFTVSDTEVSIYLYNKSNLVNTLTDGGIIMYYFKELVHKMGIDGDWKIEHVSGEDYDRVGTFKI